MKEIIAISVFLRRVKMDIGEFHFIGAYNGSFIKKLKLKGVDRYELNEKMEYILHVRIISYDRKSCELQGIILRAKSFDSLRRDF